MASDPHSTYKSTQIETASQEKILLMLYDGAIKFAKQSKKALKEDDYNKAHDKLLQTQDIITELMSSLDMEIGGEIAEELYGLYDFILHNLIQANVDKDPELVDDVLPVLEELHDAWDEVINEKGMTLEKAKREVQMNQDEGGDDEETIDDSQQIKSGPQNLDDSSSPSQSQSGNSFDGSVTYGDI